jgi:hypothetical protein
MKSKTKKILLFIVEGPTDQDALSPVLKKIFQSNDVRFHVVHGDMTSDWSVNGTNAIEAVHNHIKMEMDRYGFNKQDIIKVIHLIDTDGVFIPSNRVVLGNSKGIKYFDDRIETSIPKSILDRNTRKCQVLYRLYPAVKIGTIPYCVYYFSRNLEHVLHDENRDLDDDEKADFADTFADLYLSDTEGFKTFISTSDFSVIGNYSDTWNFITQGINSLHRYSNFHLLFTDNNLG